MRRGRRPRRSDPHACAVTGCGQVIPGWQRICTPCFKRLPFDRRRAIAQAGEAKATHIVAQLVTDAVAWLGIHSPAAETARRMGERDG